jgi:RNA polymerase sigma-70 factor (ECF subfamily)
LAKAVSFNKTIRLNTFYTGKERALVRNCLQGHRRAQRRLYDAYVDAVFHTCLRICGGTADAEDVTQETFIRVFRRLKTFNGTSSLGAWIKRIAVNTSLNHIRGQRRLTALVDAPEPSIPAQTKEVFPADGLTVERIHLAIQQLPDGSRTVLSLHLLEGYQHKEIASILGITESTSKSQYHRAKKLLQGILEPNRQRAGKS